MNPFLLYRLACMARRTGRTRLQSFRWALDMVTRGRRATAARLVGTDRKSHVEMAARSRL